jgi:DNA topoisomerase-1
LPEKQMGVDIENNFRPHYVITPKKKDVVKELKELASHASEVYLATDPDREGEAIAWHLAAALDQAIADKPVHRVEFHEITREAIDHAFANPRQINQQLVDAQQARRILDRIVGYTISPLLRKKINTKNLSAGRVQSVAVRLVVEREREIQAFVPVEYWSIEAELQKHIAPSPNHQTFRAKLIKIGDKDFECHTGEDALKLKEGLEQCAYTVRDVRRKDVLRNPSPPFITSTLQQEASRKLGFNAKRTMAIAQQLYEGINIGEGSVGLITYMRTDSTNIAESAGKEAWAYIKQKFGEEYLPKTPRVFKKKVAGRARGARSHSSNQCVPRTGSDQTIS